MLEIRDVKPLVGRSVRLTLSDGTVVDRDLTDLLHGPVFEPIVADDEVFRRVHVDYGTLVWPGEVDIAPETLIWDGPPIRTTKRLVDQSRSCARGGRCSDRILPRSLLTLA